MHNRFYSLSIIGSVLGSSSWSDIISFTTNFSQDAIDNMQDGVINIPDINEPITGALFISSQSFSLYSVLGQSSLQQAHDYYLLFVDFIIAFCLLRLAIKKWEEVTSL